MKPWKSILLAVLGPLLLLSGCRSVYYGTLEQLGWHKRDLLVDRVEDAREEQAEAKEQFQSALERFRAVVDFDGGDLGQKYDALKSQLERSESEARDVRREIDAIEEVAAALFEEWEDELDLYQSSDLRQRSVEQLQRTQQRYDDLIRAMRRAEQKMDPVLLAFRDQVLFLKHNLNAQAIAALEQDAAGLEIEIEELIREMEQAIAEADAFITAMSTPE